MSTLIKGSQDEIVIDLKTCTTFTEIKDMINREIKGLDEYAAGSEVVIDYGDRAVNNKQLRDIEDILLDRGLHLKTMVSEDVGLPLQNLDSDIPLIENMPVYHETTLLCRHLRSGQREYSRGNLVILGDVNPGAEVIAAGNIVVMGNLRGMAHAGNDGDDKTVISAYRLMPTQLRISSHITRPPDGEYVTVNFPEVARIKEGKVVIERLKI